MSSLFFETEDELCRATQHLARPKPVRPVDSPAVRRHNRWPVACEFTLLDEDREETQMTSINVSPFGAFLMSKRKFNPDRNALIALEFSSVISTDPVRVVGRVARVARPGDPDSGQCGVAVEFLDVTQNQRRELYHLTKTASHLQPALL